MKSPVNGAFKWATIFLTAVCILAGVVWRVTIIESMACANKEVIQSHAKIIADLIAATVQVNNALIKIQVSQDVVIENQKEMARELKMQRMQAWDGGKMGGE